MLSDVVVVSDLSKNFGGSTDLAKKRDGSVDLHTPIHPPPHLGILKSQILVSHRASRMEHHYFQLSQYHLGCTQKIIQKQRDFHFKRNLLGVK